MQNYISLIETPPNFFKDWIRKEWAASNQLDQFYQIDLNAEIKFDDDEIYYKIMRNKVMVGFIAIKLKDSDLFKSHFLYLYRFYIDDEFRNLGIGGEVMKKLIAMAKEMKRDIKLDCLANNPAKNLYQRFGFKTNWENMVLKIDEV